MMQVLRDNTKVIIWIIVIAFVGTIIFAWGMDLSGGSGGGNAGNVVGKVNGREIPLANFGQAADQWIENQRQQTPDKDFTESDYRQARRQAWNDFVNSFIQQDEIERLKLQLTDAELVDFLRRYPPSEVQNLEPFVTEGQFDYNKYLQAMTDPQYKDFWRQVESVVRPRFTTFKLQEYIASMVRVSDNDLQDQYLRENERIQVNYALVPYNKFSIQATDIDSASVKAYFEAHPEEFQQAEQAYYTIIKAPKLPSAADEVSALEKANQIKAQLDGGADFATLANEYTEDPSGKGKGGSLGFFAKGAMVSEFDSAVFAMEDGQVSPPVKTRFGYHVIKRTGFRKTRDLEEVEAAHILFKASASQATLDEIQQKIVKFKSEANASNATDKAREYGLTIDPERKLTPGGTMMGLGKDADVEKFLFTASNGSFSDVIDRSDAFYLVRKDRHSEAGLSSLADAYPVIQRNLMNEKQRVMAFDEAMRIYNSVMAGQILADAAKAAGLTMSESGLFSRTGRLPGMGNDPAFIGAAFALSEAKRFSQPVLTQNGAAVIEFKERSEATLDGFAAQRDTLRNRSLQTAQSAFWDSYFTKLIENAKIEDNRKALFGETM
ncbi:MAG: peptidylprolyl isomerase [Candidatus Zixiibacteriota bacterium]